MGDDLATWASRASGDGASGVPVPSVLQQRPYTCGPAVLVAVLRYFGRAVDEPRIAAEAGSTPDGTSFDGMEQALRARGLTTERRDDLTPESIKQLLKQGALVVVALQAWRDELPPLGGYANEWDEGHYVVPVAVDDDAVLFEDPAVAGRRAFLTRGEFARRWHDVDAGGVYQAGFGLVVRGKGPVLWRKLSRLPPPVRMG